MRILNLCLIAYIAARTRQRVSCPCLCNLCLESEAKARPWLAANRTFHCQASASRSACLRSLLAYAIISPKRWGTALLDHISSLSQRIQLAFVNLRLLLWVSALQSQGNTLSIHRKHKACSLSVVGQLDRARPSPSCASA